MNEQQPKTKEIMNKPESRTRLTAPSDIEKKEAETFFVDQLREFINDDRVIINSLCTWEKNQFVMVSLNLSALSDEEKTHLEMRLNSSGVGTPQYRKPKSNTLVVSKKMYSLNDNGYKKMWEVLSS